MAVVSEWVQCLVYSVFEFMHEQKMRYINAIYHYHIYTYIYIYIYIYMIQKCLWEKFFILRRPEMSTLNSRNELVSGCRHARKFLLKNVLFC